MKTITWVLLLNLNLVNIIGLFGLTTPNVVVTTGNGVVTGLELQDYNNNSYYAFQSLPYAQPPINNLRFRAPIATQRWYGVLDGTKASPQCPQPAGPTFSGQEDCLYLNVYTNALPNLQCPVLQPVLVYLHPGGFYVNSGTFSNANPQYLITENIVIVTVNYRLGALGFLTLNNTPEDALILTPNNGFRDQVLALQWIKDNIIYFGGDPNSVTLSGDSAGGLSAHYHLYSPMSQGLFHKIITRSLTALSPLESIPLNTAVDLAKQLSINTNNISRMVEALRNASLSDMYQAQVQRNWFDFRLDKPAFYGLCIERPIADSFITDDLLSLTKAGSFNRVPMMLSNTNMEGLFLNTSVVSNLAEITNVSIHIPGLFGQNSSLVEQEVNNYYFNGRFVYPYYEFWGDIWFKFGSYRTLQIASKFQTIYMANFGLDTKLNVFKLSQSRVANVYGSCHTDDDYYLFSKGASPKIVTKSIEEIWMKRIVRLQANFVKYSNPTPFADSLLLNVTWKPYDNDRSVLNLFDYNMTVRREDNQNFVFWDRMYETYAPGK